MEDSGADFTVAGQKEGSRHVGGGREGNPAEALDMSLEEESKWNLGGTLTGRGWDAL